MENFITPITCSLQCLAYKNLHFKPVLLFLRTRSINFCLLEVRVMVMALLQPLAECSAIFTVCVVLHRSPPCAVTTHKTSINKAPKKKTVIVNLLNDPIKNLLSVCLGWVGWSPVPGYCRHWPCSPINAEGDQDF